MQQNSRKRRGVVSFTGRLSTARCEQTAAFPLESAGGHAAGHGGAATAAASNGQSGSHPNALRANGTPRAPTLHPAPPRKRPNKTTARATHHFPSAPVRRKQLDPTSIPPSFMLFWIGKATLWLVLSSAWIESNTNTRESDSAAGVAPDPISCTQWPTTVVISDGCARLKTNTD